MKNLAFAVTAVVLVLASMAVAADDKVTLAPKYLAGTYVLNMSVDSDSTVTSGDREMPGGKMGMEMTMEMTVSAPDAKGDKELVMQFTKFKQTMTIANQSPTSYSSTQPSDESKEPWASIVKAMLAAKITATVSPDGSISNVKGVEEMFSNVAGDGASSAVKNQMKSFFSGDSFKELFDSGRKFLPKEPVAIGQSFQNSTKMNLPMLGALDMTIDGKVVSIDKTDEGRIATIDFQMKFDKKVESTDAGTTTKPMMPSFKQFAITQKGQMKFNVDLGITTQQKADQVMDMEMGTDTQIMKIKQKSNVAVDATFTPAK